MALSRREIGKDALQQSLDAAIATTGRVVAILVDTGRRVTAEVGGFATEVFEIAEASKRAGDDTPHDRRTHPPTP
jgi:hypothetical protein